MAGQKCKTRLPRKEESSYSSAVCSLSFPAHLPIHYPQHLQKLLPGEYSSICQQSGKGFPLDYRFRLTRFHKSLGLIENLSTPLESLSKFSGIHSIFFCNTDNQIIELYVRGSCNYIVN